MILYCLEAAWSGPLVGERAPDDHGSGVCSCQKTKRTSTEACLSTSAATGGDGRAAGPIDAVPCLSCHLSGQLFQHAILSSRHLGVMAGTFSGEGLSLLNVHPCVLGDPVKPGLIGPYRRSACP